MGVVWGSVWAAFGQFSERRLGNYPQTACPKTAPNCPKLTQTAILRFTKPKEEPRALATRRTVPTHGAAYLQEKKEDVPPKRAHAYKTGKQALRETEGLQK